MGFALLFILCLSESLISLVHESLTWSLTIQQFDRASTKAPVCGAPVPTDLSVRPIILALLAEQIKFIKEAVTNS